MRFNVGIFIVVVVEVFVGVVEEGGGGDGEGGRALGGVEYAEASAGSGADVEEASAAGEALSRWR